MQGLPETFREYDWITPNQYVPVSMRRVKRNGLLIGSRRSYRPLVVLEPDQTCMGFQREKRGKKECLPYYSWLDANMNRRRDPVYAQGPA